MFYLMHHTVVLDVIGLVLTGDVNQAYAFPCILLDSDDVVIRVVVAFPALSVLTVFILFVFDTIIRL